MLKIMENEQEIFRAWLFKIVKKDKTITGRELAAQIGVKEPTLTAYHSGRKDEAGEKKFPVIPFDKRKLILKITETAHEQMMKIGRAELHPDTIDLRKIVSDTVDIKIKAMKAEIQATEPLSKTPKPTPIDPAVQILHEALEETGVKITIEEREAITESLRRNLKEAANKEKDRIKEMLKVFKK